MSEPSLFQVLEVFLGLTRPRVKAGGYPEEIFLDLPDEDREELECSICYQILKDTRQCINKHRYCWSCIHVWSVSGFGSNHAHCPVCRTQGFYLRDKERDEKISNLTVKCQLKGCHWTGQLKYQFDHKHTNYDHVQNLEDKKEEKNSKHLPRLTTRSQQTPSSVTTATGLPTPAGRIATRNGIQTSERRTILLPLQRNNPPSATTLPDIYLQPGVRPNPAYSSYQSTSALRNNSAGRSRPDVAQTRSNLDASRNRLHSVITNFGEELERSRREVNTFQQDRERIRQRDLEQAHLLSQRLTEVAGELRRLFGERTSTGTPELSNTDD